MNRLQEVGVVAIYQKRKKKKRAERKQTRVLLADDHAVVRAGIRHLLDKVPDIHVVGEAGNGEDVLRLAKELSPDVLLLDMEMPLMSGVEVAQQLQDIGSTVQILILSAYEDKQYILQLLENGASGYLTKDEVPEMIIEAIRGVSRGEKGWVSPRVAIQLARWNKPVDLIRQYTQIELKILSLLDQKKSEGEICRFLSLRQITYNRNLQSIYSKMGVQSHGEMLQKAYELGLIQPEDEK